MSEEHNTNSFAITLSGSGGIAETLTTKATSQDSKQLWLHINNKEEEGYTDIIKNFGLPDIVTDALINRANRQKFLKLEDPKGMFLAIKGYIHNQNKLQSNIISLKMWVDENKIITISSGTSPSVEYIVNKLKKSQGPASPMDCFIAITQYSFKSMSEVSYIIFEQVDKLEEKIVKYKNKSEFNMQLNNIRRQIVSVHRYIMVQKEIFKDLPIDNPFINGKYKNQLKTISNDLNKSLDNIEYAREHVQLLQEELDSYLNISMNNNMYVLSLVIAIFTPLTVISGMFGMNLNGIPFAEHEYSFGAVSIFMFLLAATSVFIIKKKKLF